MTKKLSSVSDISEALTDLARLPIPELKTFQFRLRGHGQDLFVGTYEAIDEQRAFAQAFKACKRFELPGWSLVCVTTNTSLPVVKLTGYRDDQELMPYEARKGRRISKRV